MEGSVITDIRTVEPESHSVRCHKAAGRARGGHLVVFSNGWVEDRTGRTGLGFQIHDLDATGKTLTVHLAENSKLHKPSLFGGEWKPVEDAPPTEIAYETNKTDAREIKEFWAKHGSAQQSHPMSSETLSAPELLQARSSSIFK